VVWTSAAARAQTITTNDISFGIPDRGGISLNSDGSPGSVAVGYATIQPDVGKTSPSGASVVGFRQNNILVGEFGIPASGLLQSGRLYAEVGGSITTGIAIANPNSQAATISFHFTDSSGSDFGSGGISVPANGQIARLFDQAPFNSGSIQGSLTSSSTVPVASVGLRAFTNERGDYLITTLPVLDLSAPPGNSPAVLADFADGGPFTTQAIPVNPTDSTLTGNIQFRDVSGGLLVLTANGQTLSTFPFSIPPRSSFKLLTGGSGGLGSIYVTPDPGSSTPMSVPVISYKTPSGITATSSFNNFVITGPPPPILTSISPSGGMQGSIVTIVATGSNFLGNPTISLTDFSLPLLQAVTSQY
jgi:hypothetical protein